MARHEDKLCPRCGSSFECKSGTVLLCQCATVELQQAHLDYIAQRFDDCLCAACLLLLREQCDQSASLSSADMA